MFPQSVSACRPELLSVSTGIHNYIADFVCRDKWLIVEVDGGQHAESEAMAYDAKRTAYFVSLGYRVLRVWGSEVMENVEGVLEEILAWLEFVPE
jgi:very-short-patch-repair endonuclease